MTKVAYLTSIIRMNKMELTTVVLQAQIGWEIIVLHSVCVCDKCFISRIAEVP